MVVISRESSLVSRCVFFLEFTGVCCISSSETKLFSPSSAAEEPVAAVVMVREPMATSGGGDVVCFCRLCIRGESSLLFGTRWMGPRPSVAPSPCSFLPSGGVFLRGGSWVLCVTRGKVFLCTSGVFSRGEAAPGSLGGTLPQSVGCSCAIFFLRGSGVTLTG